MLEDLSMSLAPMRGVVETLAGTLTILQFFAGLFPCNEIRQKKTTEGMSSTPFVAGVTLGLCMYKYGAMLDDSTMKIVNLVAIVLNALYCAFYYLYSPNKWNDILKPLAIGSAIVAIFWGYAEIESADNVEYRYGLLVTILLLLALGAPLINVKEIIATKDASSIPFAITFMATIVTFLWLLYGIIILNNFMIFQNVVGFTLSAVQLILCFKYPKSSQAPDGSPTRRRSL